MRNFIEDGKHIKVPAPKAVLSGELLILGELMGICVHAAENGDDLTLATEGVFEFTKDPARPLSLGDPAYWREDKAWITNLSHYEDGELKGENKRIGVIVQEQATETPSCRVKLNQA